MNASRRLVVVGEAPHSTLAASIGIMERGAANVRVVDLPPDRIASTGLEFLNDEPSDVIDLFAAIGPSALNFARFDLWARLRIKGYRCATLIHPLAIVDPSVTLGDNVLVGPGAIVEPDAKVGRGTILGAASVVGTSSTIAPWCWIAVRVTVGADSRVGSHTVLGTGVQLADRTEFPGPGEINIAGTYRGILAAGMFISPEFPHSGARLVRAP